MYTTRKKSNSVFISEDLTAVRNKLLYKAKRHRDAGIFKYAWSRDGTIKVMLQSGAVQSLTLMAHLDSLVEHHSDQPTNQGWQKPG